MCVVRAWVCVLGAASASAHTVAPDARTTGNAIETDASLVLLIDDLAGALRSPAGVSLRAALSDLGVFGQTAESWAELSDALGVSSDEAIEGLLGGRVLLLAGGARDARDVPVPWACAMSVEPGFARRMAKSLKAAPRGTEAGRTVYAIEDGRLVVLPVDDWSRLVVATPGHDDLRRTAIEAAMAWGNHDGPIQIASEPGTWISTSPDTEGGESDEQTRSILGAFLYKPADAPWLTGTIRTLLGRDHAGGGDAAPGWVIRFTASDPHGGASAHLPVTNEPRIDRGWYDSVTAEAGIAYAGPIGGSARRLPISLGPLGDDVQSLRKWTGVFLPFDPPGSLLRDEADFGVLTAGTERAGSVWLRVTDAPQAAKIGDAYVCDLVGMLAGAGAVSVDDPECTCRFPVAMRRLDLPSAGPRRHDLGDLGFAWGATRVSVLGLDREPSPWWSMHSIPAGRRPPAIAPGLSADPAAPLVRFTVRPMLLIDRLGESGALASMISSATMGGLEGLRRFALVDLEIVETPPSHSGEPPGTVGRLVLRVRPGTTEEVGSPG